MENKTDRIVSMAMFRKSGHGYDVLVVNRGGGMAQGQWGLPSGHINFGESPINAAYRELREETGISQAKLQFVAERPSMHGPRDYVFTAVVPPGVTPVALSDAKSARWVPVAKMPPLAFESQQFVFLAYAKLFGSRPAMEGLVGRRFGARRLLAESVDVSTGTLIVFEGIDGSGKSTQANRLSEWLTDKGYAVIQTKWNSSPLLSEVIDKAKQERVLTPILYSLLHAADLIHRYNTIIKPALEDNKVVVSDRYYYTSMVRDGVRGVDQMILEMVYRDLRRPDVIFHCVTPTEITLERLHKDKDVGYYSAGMDMNFSNDRTASLKNYMEKMFDKYQQILPYQPGYCRIDGDQSVKDVFRAIKKHVSSTLHLGSMDEHLSLNEVADVIAEDLESNNGLIF